MAKSSSSAPRKRGAPRGNQNALKHGFYSRFLREQEISDVQANLSAGLSDEIKLLRVLIQRALKQAADPSEETGLLDSLRFLDAVRQATALLSRLLLAHHQYIGELTPAHIHSQEELRRMGLLPWDTGPLEPDARAPIDPSTGHPLAGFFPYQDEDQDFAGDQDPAGPNPA